MKKYEVIQIIRDSRGKPDTYVLLDEQLKEIYLRSELVKARIRQNEIELIGYRLTSDDRLIEGQELKTSLLDIILSGDKQIKAIENELKIRTANENSSRLLDRMMPYMDRSV